MLRGNQIPFQFPRASGLVIVPSKLSAGWTLPPAKNIETANLHKKGTCPHRDYFKNIQYLLLDLPFWGLLVWRDSEVQAICYCWRHCKNRGACSRDWAGDSTRIPTGSRNWYFEVRVWEKCSSFETSCCNPRKAINRVRGGVQRLGRVNNCCEESFEGDEQKGNEGK